MAHLAFIFIRSCRTDLADADRTPVGHSPRHGGSQAVFELHCLIWCSSQMFSEKYSGTNKRLAHDSQSSLVTVFP